MIVLGIETATAVCAAAVAVDGAATAEQALEQHAVHAEKLLTLIDRALREAGFTADQVNGIAVSIGPGSFTGLRIGLSVAKGLAFATGVPLVAVPTLSALAYHAAVAPATAASRNILTVLDARRDEVYCQLFDVGGGRPVPLWDARACPVPELIRELGGRAVLVTGDAREKVLAVARTMPGGTARFGSVPPGRARCSAAAVAVLGSGLLAEGSVEDPGTLEPRYIKEFFLTSR